METVKMFLFLCLFACVLIAPPAEAVSIDIGASTLNGNAVVDFSYLSTDKLDFDLTFNSLNPVSLVVRVGINEASSIGFAANFINETPWEWTDFHMTLEGDAVFSEINDIFPFDGGSVNVTPAAPTPLVDILFQISQVDGFSVGYPVPNDPPPPDPLPPQPEDWLIDVRVQEVRRFTLTLQPTVENVIPEPSTWLLLGVGLIGIGLATRRRK